MHMMRGGAVVALLLVWGAVTPVSALRLFTSGFELQSAVSGIEWYSDSPIADTGVIYTSLGRVRSGAASLRILNPTSATAKGQSLRMFTAPTAGRDYFARAYVWIDTLPNVATSIMGYGDGGTANRARVSLGTDGKLSLLVDTGGSLETLGPGATTLATGQWYRLSLRTRRHLTTPDASADQAEVLIDGVQELTSSTLSMVAGPSRFHIGANLLGTETCTALDIYFDDVAVNDSTGASQTSWPGVGSIALLVPDAAGEFSNSMTLSGSAPAATAWESADDGLVTGTVDGVDYLDFTVNTSNWTGAGSRVALAMSCMPGSPSSVTLVAVGIRLTNAGATNSQLNMSAQTSNGGTKATDFNPSAFTLNGVWNLNGTDATRAASPFTLYTDPDAAAWTETSINTLQVLVRSVDATPTLSITSLWAMVEHVGGSGGCSGGGGGSTAAPRLLMMGVGGKKVAS